jgi:CubicO group peptidase (beta-lactamase class C family)
MTTCHVSAILLLTLATAGVACAFEWQTASPESQGMNAARLEAMRKELAARGTDALLVIRHDRIVCEWYASGQGRSTNHYTASLAKAIVGGMSLALALGDRRLTPDDLACRYVPSWRDDPRKSKITIRHLATHASGIQDAEEEGKSHEQLTGWMGQFWKQQPNPFLNARDDAPVLFEPGSGYAYSNPGMAMLSYCVAAALHDAPEPDVQKLLAARIMEPIGVPPREWSMSYGKSFELDGLLLRANWGGGAYSPNAVARIGRLMLRRGDWDGRRLISADTVDLMTADAGMPTPDRAKDPAPRSGLCWWLNSDGVFDNVPRDAFMGAGAGNQLLIVIPSLDLVAVRNGAQIDRAGFWAGVEAHLLNPLMAAVSDPPYPPSRVIRRVDFAPESAIVRDAIGSDNWPITWGDDGEQYTSYGDGWGFEPRTEGKLSLGFARIIGPPEGFRGVNIRAPADERTGEGPRGPKASGMLMVDGVLYMWVRNTSNSTLAWSADHGATWTWGFRFTESFGCPSFLNFRRNYEGARDEYVYTYSSDGPTAYNSYDRIVLARVPKGRIRDRSAYEFLERVDEGGAPVWTADLARRGAAFAYPGHCQRLDVAYDPGIRRYLMALGFNHDGGWGIFDAPEPWGPWTTAFHTTDWGLGGTHGYRLPAKWISADGTTMYLIFSGVQPREVDYDAFCVRRLKLALFPRPHMDLRALLPDAEALASAGEGLPRITPAPDVERYNRDNLSDYCDGGAAKYLAYDFVELSVRRYTTDAGKAVTVELYSMASADDAYGLWSNDRRGEHPDLGADAHATYAKGLLEDCKGPLFCRVLCIGATDRERDLVLAMARQIAGKVAGAAEAEPALIRRLPSRGLVADSAVYFHEDATLGHVYYLADGNPLDLSARTNGVLAEYRRGDDHAVAIVVEYPTRAEADAAFRRFCSTYLPERELTAGATQLTAPVERGRFCAAATRGAHVFVVLEAKARTAAEGLMRDLETAYAGAAHEKGADAR